MAASSLLVCAEPLCISSAELTEGAEQNRHRMPVGTPWLSLPLYAVTATLLDPDKYAGQLIPVWDEQLTPTELVATFAKVTGKPAKCAVLTFRSCAPR